MAEFATRLGWPMQNSPVNSDPAANTRAQDQRHNGLLPFALAKNGL